MSSDGIIRPGEGILSALLTGICLRGEPGERRSTFSVQHNEVSMKVCTTQVAEHKGITLEFHSTEREILTPIPPMANNKTGPGLIVDSIYDENDS